MSRAMTPRRLAWTLRSRGADLASWPETERFAALHLARTDQAARLLLEEALVQASAEDAPPLPDHAVQDRLCGRVRQALAPVGRSLRWGALAVGLCAGIGLGLLSVTEAETASDVTISLLSAVQADAPSVVLAAIDP